jgi:hypothetical protein
MARAAPVYILEGTWWSHLEVPQVLPYFHALSISHRNIELSHRTIRSAEDIAHYVSKIPRNAGSFLYFACHGERQRLYPMDDRLGIETGQLVDALARAKPGAVSFIHFGCCEMVEAGARRRAHAAIMKASGAKWVSGYMSGVDWLQCMFLDLALVSEVFVPMHRSRGMGRKGTKLKPAATRFIRNYEQLARGLGFSALSHVTGGPVLFPKQIRT